MRYILTTLLFLIFSLGITAQDVKIKGPKRQQTTTSKTKQNNSDRKANIHSNDKTQTTEQNYQEPAPIEHIPQELHTEIININGVSFTMCYVKGGEFMKGGYTRTPVEDFYIGQTEVTQELWTAIMGKITQYDHWYNKYEGKYTDGVCFGNKYPITGVSWEDCQKFIQKLNSLTGLSFRLPTEAEWEFAAKGGNNTRECKYSGSNRLSDVGRYKYNSNHKMNTVASLQANELGIFDMSGNAYEWCQELYNVQIGNSHVLRGGGFETLEEYCKNTARKDGNGIYTDTGFRLALTQIPPQYHAIQRQRTEQYAREQVQRKQDEENRNALRWDDATKTFYYNGQSYKMVAVEGGTFEMGVPKDRKKNMLKEKYEEAKPHKVTLSSYYIGQTEFTRGFLRAVLGEKNGSNQEDLLPIGLSWDDCKKIADWLSQYTGKNFCIPSEAEWEFAARGGNRSHGYSMSGCNHNGHTVEPYPGLEDRFFYAVSNSLSNGSNVKVPMKNVASKKPNELGIYDMSGNVWEWCSDWYAKYETKDVTNPMGANTGTMRVYRGGSHVERVVPCVYERFSDYPDKSYSNVGFRLCLRP